MLERRYAWAELHKLISFFNNTGAWVPAERPAGAVLSQSCQPVCNRREAAS
jgi:hypothetical protein